MTHPESLTLTLIPTGPRQDHPVQDRLIVEECESAYVGRSSRCPVRLSTDSHYVSRLHAVLAHRSGRWFVTDESRHGTFLAGERLTPGEPAEIGDGASLRFGDCEFLAQIGDPEESLGPEGTYTMSSQAVDLGAVDSSKILQAALELPELLGHETEEERIYSVACEYLVKALTPVIATSYVTITNTNGATVLGRAERADVLAARGATLRPIVSRRVVQRLREAPNSVLFMHRDFVESTIGATVDASTHSLGASLLETDSRGQYTILYVVGDVALRADDRLVGQYLRLVATLVRQHLITLRRAHLAKYFSPTVVQLLSDRDGRATVEGEPHITTATSLFFDVRGSSLPMNAVPAHLANVYLDLRRVLSIVTETVFEAQGTIIDYAGDSVLAAWGVPFEQPEQADLAVGCALEIWRRLNNESFRALGRDENLCGIGIALGDVLV
ncbi:MAG TPA: adenylate/guanylate cyclase domain-containing protein, partial [Polyangiales bacterium]|nr:adenylate/guanylate cyclase domain-containing protein [Polyangiales bacterium]